MNFGFSEEQEELRTAVRRFLDDKSPSTEVRRLMETTEGYDPAVWSQMANQLGLQALTIPEEYGGAGFGYVELVVVLEEMGRSLLCAPYFSTVALAANALLASGDESAKAEYLPGIASGETIATLAFTEESGRWDEDGITMQAQQAGDGWSLEGTKSYVVDGYTANLVIVAARTGNGISLFAVAGDADGSRRGRHLRPWTRPASRPGSRLRARRPASSARKVAPARPCRRRSTSPPSHSLPSRSGERSGCST